MKIKKSSWHGRLYVWLFKLENDGISNISIKKLTLCQYVQKLIYGTAIVATIGTLCTLFSFLVMPFFGFIPRRLTFPIVPSSCEIDADFGIRRYQKFSLGSFKFYPAHIILVLGIIYLLYCLVPTVASPVLDINITPGVLWISVSAFLLTLILIAGSKARSTETWYLIKSYISAKKQKVCPLIEWDD